MFHLTHLSLLLRPLQLGQPTVHSGDPRLGQQASRVALSVSLERDSHRVPPLERVISLAVPHLVPPPEARHHQKQNCQLSPHG